MQFTPRHDPMGPDRFERIRRKGGQRFGAGNFQALFESIKPNPMRRGGVLVSDPA